MDIFSFFWLFLAFLSGIGLKIAFDWGTRRQALSLYGAKGQQVKKEQEAGVLALITEVVQGFQAAKAAGTPLKEAAMPILTKAAANNPAAAMKLVGKLGKQVLGQKGGASGLLGDLGGLLE
jgi:hypothetical protein